MANYLSKDEDLVNNPSTRVPICLCLDLSGSMNTVEGGEYRDTGRTEMIDGKLYSIVEGGETRVGELQNGLELFFDAIKNDDMAVDAAEVSIVGFSNNAKKLLEFDKELIKSEGYSTVTPVLISNFDQFDEILATDEKYVQAGDIFLRTR